MNNSFKTRLGQPAAQPFNPQIQTPTAGTFTKRIGSDSISVPEMKTPEEMEQQMTDQPTQVLPYGAVGWNPDGTASYGTGIDGWWKGITSRIYAPVTEQIGGEDVTREANWTETIPRAEGEALMQVIAGLQVPQQKFYEYLADRRSLEMQADMVNRNMPDIYNDNEMGNFLRLTSAMIPGISNLTTMYEKDRIKNGTRTLPEGDIAKLKEANRIWNKENVGTSLVDLQVQNEYIKRVMNGEDPYKLSKEYKLPIANFIADVALDPTNVFDGLGIASKFLGTAGKVAKTAVIADKLADVGDILSKADKATDVTNVITDVASRVSKMNLESANDAQNIAGTLMEATQDSKKVLLFDKANGVITPLIRIANGDLPTYSNLIEGLIKIGSSKADDIADGYRTLQQAGVAHLFMSDNALETARFYNKLFDTTKGRKILLEAAKSNDIVKYIEEVSPYVNKVLDDIYPDVTKIADNLDEIAKFRKSNPGQELPSNLAKWENYKLSKTAAYWARKNKALQTDILGTGKGVGDINSLLSLVYLSTPGFAARNMMNAASQAFIDLGPKALINIVDEGGSLKYIEDMFGLVPDSLKQGFSALQTAQKQPKGILKAFGAVRDLAAKGESRASVAIAARSGKQYSNAMLKEGKFIESLDVLRKAGFDDNSVRMLEKLIRKNNGQTGKAIEEFTNMMAKGNVEYFREPEMIFGEQLLGDMERFDPQIVDQLREAMKTGDLDEIMTKVNKITDDYVKTMYKGAVDNIPPAADAPGVEEFTRNLIERGDDAAIDDFAKKANVRRDLVHNIDRIAKQLLDPVSYDNFVQKNYETTRRIQDITDVLSSDVRMYSDKLIDGTLSVDELLTRIKSNDQLKHMFEYGHVINAKTTPNAAAGILWDFYKHRTGELWNGTAMLAKEALESALPAGTKSGLLDDLSVKFLRDWKYMNASDLKKIKDLPDINTGQMPTLSDALKAQWAGYKRMMDGAKASISRTYGKGQYVTGLDQVKQKALSTWAKRNEVKMLDFRTRLLSHMKATRDFALLDYAGGKRNFDVALSYLFPYQFWYSRTYANWIKRLVSNPALMTRYAHYRKFLEDQNKDLPSYMRNNIVLGKSFGLAENPLIINLEASLNPLNGVTGIDFTDKRKIVGEPGTLEYMWTKTLDGIGKMGPSVWSPISMATAGVLAANGEKDAAARWAGRAIPQTLPIKAVGSLLGQNWEVDPFVALFGEGTGTDPYERRRVGRALIAMSEAGKITKEQAYEAARTMSGDVWKEASILATKNRAVGTLSAYTLGQGFKARSASDAEIDKFYEDYMKMWANADKFSPDEMSNYQKYIREKYPFADLVLLSNKGSAERDKAYAYSVLSRIAPGQSSTIFDSLGINPILSDKFYNDKGDMSAWNPLDKEDFMNAMVQIGTLLAIPENTTAKQWQDAKLNYRQLDPALKERFGEDIVDKIEAYYEFAYDSNEQKNYMESNPDVQQAMDYKDYLISTTPILAQYYGGLDKLERYYMGQFRTEVTKNIDPNYFEYYKMRGLIIDPKELANFDKKIGWKGMQAKYQDFKREWDVKVFKKLDEYDRYFIQEPIPSQMQEGVNPSAGQQSIMETLAPTEQEKQASWEQINSVIPMPLTLEKALQNYVATNKPLSTTEYTMLGKLANVVNEKFGTNYQRDDILSLALQYYSLR